jgi:hypothetical protein
MKTFFILWVCVGLIGASAAEPGLRAGAAAVDITPKEFPLNMPGGFSANLAESAHDPLHARAMTTHGRNMAPPCQRHTHYKP